MATLITSDLVFSYGKRAILDGVSLDLTPGHLLGVLGVNGSGKSTLLNVMDDLLHPSAGQVTLDGTPVGDMAPAERARAIAYVTQHSHANRSTVFETLLLGRKPHMKGSPAEEDFTAVERAIAQFHLEDLAERYVDELSGGEYQKMVIARAFVQDTPVLLLDEPTNNLDLANQLEVLRSVRDAARVHGVAAAAVLHDINLALAFCDEVAILKGGRLMARVAVSDVTGELLSEAFDVQVELVQHGGRRFALVTEEGAQATGEPEGASGADATGSVNGADMADSMSVAGKAGEVGETDSVNGAGAASSADGSGEADAQAAPCPTFAQTPFGDVAAFFDERAATWDDCAKLRPDTKRRLTQLLPDLEDAQVLDVACGTGIMIPYYLSRNAERVVAIDISSQMAALAREKFAGDDRVCVLCGDVLDTPLPQVDTVVIYNAYPHFPDKSALVKRVFELLSPGGVCLVAHGMGRKELNGHHGAQAAGVSTALEPAVVEMQPWLDAGFAVTALADEDNFYALRMQKLQS